MKTKRDTNEEQESEQSLDNTVENITSNPNPLEEKVKELTDDLQRTRADFENFRKQVEIQKTQAKQIERLSTILRFLPLLDDIDRAVATYPEQLSPLSKSIDKLKKDLMLEKIDSDPDAEFNPDLHDAVMVEESDGEKEVIAETLRPGYYYDGKVVRTAMVRVKRI